MVPGEDQPFYKPDIRGSADLKATPLLPFATNGNIGLGPTPMRPSTMGLVPVLSCSVYGGTHPGWPQLDRRRYAAFGYVVDGFEGCSKELTGKRLGLFKAPLLEGARNLRPHG